MRQWKYITFRVSDGLLEKSWLDYMGKDGWELAGFNDKWLVLKKLCQPEVVPFPSLKSSFWHKFRIITNAPLWFFWPNEERKSWEAFKSGLIKHEHKFTGEIFTEQGYRFQKCGRFGCTLVNPLD